MKTSVPLRISKLEKTRRQNPGVPLFARVADEHLRRGRVSRALALCQEGCERFPDYPTGFLLLGRCYEARGNFEEARNLFEVALRLDPQNSAGFAALSEAYEQLGNITLALQCMRQAAFLDPYSQDLFHEAERLRRRSAAAPLVLPPGPAAEPKEEGGRVEAGGEPSPEGSIYPGDLARTNQEVPGNGNAGISDVEAPAVHAREEGEVREPENGLSVEDPPAPSVDSSPVAPPSGETEGRHTRMFYRVSEPERVAPGTGTGDPAGWSEKELEPEAPLPAPPEADDPDAPGSDISAREDPGPGQPVAWLSNREDHELIGLLSEIGTGEEEGPGPAPEAGEEEDPPPGTDGDPCRVVHSTGNRQQGDRHLPGSPAAASG